VGLAGCSGKEWEAEVGGVCRRDGAAVGQEDIDARIGWPFVVMGDVGVNEMACGTCVGYGWGVGRGGGVIGRMQS